MSEPTKAATVIHLAWIRWWSALAYYAFSMASGLREIGCGGWIVAPPGSPLASRSEAAGFAPPNPDRWRDLASTDPARLLRAILHLRRAGRGGEVSAVVVHTGRCHAAAALALRGGSVPLVRVRSEIRRPTRGPLQDWLYGHGTDRCVLSGEFMRRGYLDGLGIPPERIVTVPAGIDCAPADRIDRGIASARLREARGWPRGGTVVGMLARYSPVKGHRTLVEAARILLQRGRDIYFFMAGTEAEIDREGLARVLREAGEGDRFAVLDRVEDPFEVAAGFDIALILSEGSEAICRSALEYMAIGLPIVATRINVIPETVGDAAVLIPPGDPAALADAIDRLLASPEWARSLGRAAAERARREFDTKRIATRTWSILQDARMTRRRGP